MPDILLVARKEFRGFFATPAAYLFLGAYLAATLFVFFWVDTFFARNIADVRPLFQWLPVLLIFLVAALTMRSWSEERRSGTLESLLTSPVRPLDLVLGKFLAALGLVVLALALTLPLPVTVSFLGPLDWGPVAGGYVATVFLAAAYVAIGVYMSSRTDNPIVSLILTVLVCGLFYLVGSDTLAGLFGYHIGGVMALFGTGSRFASITRGVLDLRDLYYYVSIVGVFLSLNLFSLEKLRWAGNPAAGSHRLWGLAVALTAANFAAANFWLAPIGFARVDITQGHLYSLSAATRQELAKLKEPLVIKGYFSAKTHPLLAPLAPQMKDLLEEYAAAAGGRARVEFIDPTRDRSQAEEAAARYGVRPVPFQTASRYQTSVVSSYFDVVVAYGDQHETLGYRDLIEVKERGDNDMEVMLKNPEYAITRAVRKVVGAYRTGGNPFETLVSPVVFHGYLSPGDKLPAELKTVRADLDSVLDEMKKQSGGKFTADFQDPDADGGKLGKQLRQKYGFGPKIASLTDPTPFWFSMVVEGDGQTVQVPFPAALGKEALKQSLDSALQRLAPGFLKTVAVFAPEGYGPDGKSYQELTKSLSENERVVHTDLKSGNVPDDADLLLVLAPSDLNDKQRFAIDQFLMRGGSVVLATSPFDIQVGQGLDARKQASGLEQWLASYGLAMDDRMVLDRRNAALPVPVQRSLGGVPIQEIRMLPYPHFPDLRGKELNQECPVTSSLGQLTMNWASPITVDAGKNKGRKVIRLLESSPQSWTSASLDLVPDYRAYPSTGFAVEGRTGPRLLAVALEGRFDSFYKGKPSPLAQAAGKDPGKNAGPAEQKPGQAPGQAADKVGGQGQKNSAQAPPVAEVIDRSPDSARLVLVSSDTFGTDAVLDLASQGLGTTYAKPVEFMQNAIDWSLEDPALLSLRGRTQLARTLNPMPEGEERLWEYLNYVLALAGLCGVWVWRRQAGKADERRYQNILGRVES